MKKALDTTGKIIGLVVLILSILIIAANSKDVLVSLLAWSIKTPLALLMGVVFTLGLIIGWIFKLGDISRRSERVQTSIDEAIKNIKDLIDD
ncbi:LapA family protein [Streptococcaceae bacterium ESL0729]|nr:LapA family protein [Streptococcaceae bacterium ESL0729]